MAGFNQWMEIDRLKRLERDWENYERSISERYSWLDSEDHRRKIEFQKRSYDNDGLKIIGVGIAIAVAALIFLEDFFSGAVFILALVIGGFAFHHHNQTRPDFEALADPRDEEHKTWEAELRKRRSDPSYDRATWLRENGYEVAYQPGDEIEVDVEGPKFEQWQLRPVSEDDGTEPAFILTLLKKSKSYDSDEDRLADRDGLFWIKIERRDPDGSIETVEDREWGGWPVSWTRDEVESMARELNYSAFGRDEYV